MQANDKSPDTSEKTLLPSKGRNVMGLMLFVFITFLSFLLVFTGHGIGWMMLLIGLPGLAMYITKLRPMSEFLRLDDEGFTVKTLFHEVRIEWKDVENFGKMKQEGSPAVGFDLHPDAPTGEETQKLLSCGNHYAYVLPSNYSMPPGALAALLKKYHARVVGDDESE